MIPVTTSAFADSATACSTSMCSTAATTVTTTVTSASVLPVHDGPVASTAGAPGSEQGLTAALSLVRQRMAKLKPES